MSERRISAGELEDAYKAKHRLYDFFDEMFSEVFRHFEYKGTSWKHCKTTYLKKQLRKCVKENDWVDAANFCFMLRDREINGSSLEVKINPKKDASKQVLRFLSEPNNADVISIRRVPPQGAAEK